MHARRFLLLLLLSLRLSLQPLSAEVCLTDAEFEELTTIFATLENTLTTQSLELETLQTQLETAETQLVESQTAIEMLKQTSIELKKSLQGQRLAQIKNVILAAVISAAVGLIAGLLL